VALALIGFIDAELTKQHCGHRIGLVALVRFGEEFALDLSSAQRHITGNQSGADVTDHADARYSCRVIVPGVTAEPAIQRVPPTIEMASLIVFQERAWRRYFRHVGGLPARSLSPAIWRAGFDAQASNRSQSLAGMVTIRRSSTSVSASLERLAPHEIAHIRPSLRGSRFQQGTFLLAQPARSIPTMTWRNFPYGRSRCMTMTYSRPTVDNR